MTSSTHLPLILGTAGHIDHGKSSLIKALTGYDPDRLAEEKKRGITIELGFTQLDLGENLSMGVVDVPGHERFVRQMIAGATGIDVALFCIAADDGIMPQTIEHKAILELLAIPSVIVALTKVDLVDDEWVTFVTQEIKEFLASSPFAHAPIIPTSSQTGEGLDAIREALRSASLPRMEARRGTSVRLPVDRVFSIKGSGTVVTGTLWSGTVSVDDELEVLPSRQRTRVRSVQVHDHAFDTVLEGNRTALNLSSLKKEDIRPGDFLVTPQSLEPSDRFDAWLTCCDTSSSGKRLKNGSRIHLAHGTREVLGRILFMNGKDVLSPQESTFVQIRLEEPLPLSWKDRFIVRSYSPVQVIGGGKVLLCNPAHRSKPSPEEISLLEALLKEDEMQVTQAAFALQTIPVTAPMLARRYGGIPSTVFEKNLSTLVANRRALILGKEGKTPYYTTPSLRTQYLSAIENTLLRFHTENPTQTGISKLALKQICGKNMDEAGFDALLFEAEKDKKILISEGEISHPKAGGGAKKLEEQTAKKLWELLEEAGEKPPVARDLIAQSKTESTVAYRALGALEEAGRIHRVSNDFYFSDKALAHLTHAATSYLKEHSSASTTELKDAMATSRKYAIPLLEYFDTQGITRREGDARFLR